MHSSRVNDLSFDAAGEWIASCSDDGNVMVLNLYEPLSRQLTYPKVMKTVALHPGYSQNVTDNCGIVFGGVTGELIMNTKGWFSYSDQILHAGEGAVYCIRWRKTLIAWANDLGIKIFDIQTGEKLSFIERPVGSPSADKFKCSIQWSSDNTLMIAWADSIKVAVIRTHESTDLDDAANLSAAVGGSIINDRSSSKKIKQKNKTL